MASGKYATHSGIYSLKNKSSVRAAHGTAREDDIVCDFLPIFRGRQVPLYVGLKSKCIDVESRVMLVTIHREKLAATFVTRLTKVSQTHSWTTLVSQVFPSQFNRNPFYDFPL